MRQFGLIGYPLTHSFSKKYFTNKFEMEGIVDCQYELYQIQSASEIFTILKNNPSIEGLNVTIPHKEAIIPHLSSLDGSAEEVGAVNVIKVEKDRLIGYNSDFYGFKTSLMNWTQGKRLSSAIVLGTGGASKAILAVLKALAVETTVVSRSAGKGRISYNELADTDQTQKAQLIVNTTPLGMYPDVDNAPPIPYDQITNNSFAFDLVYNPKETLFLHQARAHGAKIKNGLEMLELQAEKSWDIWNS